MTFLCFQMEERKKKQQQPVKTDYWLHPNIVVKVVTKKLGERYHKRKAVVMVTTSFLFLVRGRCCLGCFYAFYIQIKAII